MNSIRLKISNTLKITMVLAVVIFLGLSDFCLAADDESGGTKVMSGLTTATDKGFGSTEGDGIVTSIPGAIGKIIGIALSFIGLAFFVLMIYGGFIWMFARGNDQDVQRAKDLIQSAVIGLIIVLSAYAITVFVGNALTGGKGSSSGEVYYGL